jgi:hypothetical protein
MLNSLIVIVNCGRLWCLREPRMSCCQVLSLARCILIQISVTASNMGDGLIAVSKCSNSTFIMLHMHLEMDVGYFVGQ